MVQDGKRDGSTIVLHDLIWLKLVQDALTGSYYCATQFSLG